MTQTVHILNGDSTSFGIKKGNINGDIIVWREMLADGFIDKDVGSDVFWKKRYSFFENELGISKLDYYDKCIKELVKIEDLSNYNEVVLWFEFDLFCQVNLMALCTYLLKYYRNDISYFLVCVGKEKDRENLQTLADFSPKEYQYLYNDKIRLSRNDLLFAKESWEVYVNNNEKELGQYNFNKNVKFKYLQLAIDQHLKRFPGKGGLNQVEYKILELISSNGRTKKDIIRDLLNWQRCETVYGFGDLQYILHLRKLNDFYKIKDQQYYLNNKGKSILA